MDEKSSGDPAKEFADELQENQAKTKDSGDQGIHDGGSDASSTARTTTESGEIASGRDKDKSRKLSESESEGGVRRSLPGSVGDTPLGRQGSNERLLVSTPGSGRSRDVHSYQPLDESHEFQRSNDHQDFVKVKGKSSMATVTRKSLSKLNQFTYKLVKRKRQTTKPKQATPDSPTLSNRSSGGELFDHSLRVGWQDEITPEDEVGMALYYKCCTMAAIQTKSTAQCINH